ncbi:hypothetical protein, partial [Salmonella sp. s54412]|uniref:hypothetical protein n=1 Tax=Salmonella sp. s54412 TaxID=3160128 RepID=UPI00375500E4
AMAVYGQLTKPSYPSSPDEEPTNKGTRLSSSNLSDSDRTENSFGSENGTKAELKMDTQEHNVSSSQWQQIPELSQTSHFTAADSPTRKRDFL